MYKTGYTMIFAMQPYHTKVVFEVQMSTKNRKIFITNHYFSSAFV